MTLRKKEFLRGCIGFIEPVLPLYQAVIQTSVYAACRDQRFPPVSEEELDDLETVLNWITKNYSTNINFNLSNISLLGHSRGGGILTLKANEDSRISKVISLL